MKMQRSGFIATILAITLLGLVTAALVTMAAVAKADFRRTASIQTQAQLRQLLLVGAADVSQRARKSGAGTSPQTWSIGLPKELAQEGERLSVELTVNADGSAEAHVRAVAGAQIAEQWLQFGRSGDRWTLMNVRLQ